MVYAGDASVPACRYERTRADTIDPLGLFTYRRRLVHCTPENGAFAVA